MPKAEIFKMPSGANLHVGMAEFQKSSALMQAVLKQLVGMKLSPADLQRDISDLRGDPAGIMAVVDRAISLATSDDVKKAVFTCASTVKYSPKGNEALISVDESLFDDEEFGVQAREDYYTIMFRITEVNCKPFLVKVLSGLLKPKNPGTPALA